MIKDIVVNLSLGDDRDAAADFAVSAGTVLQAHIAGIAFVYEPFVPSAEMFVVPADMIESQRLANEQAAAGAVARFEEAARRNAVSAESRTLEATASTASDTFARIARRFDLSVVSQPRPESQGSDEMMVEAAMFNSGRPVLIVPYVQQAALTLERVMVCWDGSRTAARAIADAMPLLARARTTEVVTVTDGSEQTSEVPGIDIAKHLARHGIGIELKRLVRGDSDIADIILSHAADMSADLIVMGGYGHSRLREFVLGGVTRRMLKSMVAPTLMSH